MNADTSGEFIFSAFVGIAVLSGIARGVTRAVRGEGFFKGFGEGFINTFKIIGGTFGFDWENSSQISLGLP